MACAVRLLVTLICTVVACCTHQSTQRTSHPPPRARTHQALIAVVGPRSAATVVGMVAAVKRGSAFMLVDDELPAKRIQLMGRTARPAVVSSNRTTFIYPSVHAI
jgi:non-ribosomal peptide synthetase component F